MIQTILTNPFVVAFLFSLIIVIILKLKNEVKKNYIKVNLFIK